MTCRASRATGARPLSSFMPATCGWPMLLQRCGSVSSASSPTSPEAMAPDSAPALRLGIFPIVLLAAEFHAGTTLPFLAPLFATILLMKGPRRPKLQGLVQLFALIMAVTLGLV